STRHETLSGPNRPTWLDPAATGGLAVELFDRVAGANGAALEDIGTQASLAAQSGADSGPGQRLEMVTWIAGLDALTDGIAHSELAAHQRIDVDAAGQDVASRLLRL